MKRISITSSRRLKVLLLTWCLMVVLGCAQSGQAPSTPAVASENQPRWTATVLSFQAAQAAGRRLTPMGTVEHDIPDGLLGYTIVVDRGYGSFHMAVPRPWIGWWVGRSPMRLLDAASKVDAQFSEEIRTKLESAVDNRHSSLRSLFLANKNGAIMLLTVHMSGHISKEQWQAVIEDPERLHVKNAEMKAADVVQYGTSQAMKVEWYFPFPEGDLVQIKYFIREVNNDILWTLECQSLASLIDQYRQTCTDSVATFFPGPYIISDYE